MPNLNRSITINEMDFHLDDFNEQKIYVGALAQAHKIKNLLFMRPGDFPSLPEMGINIQSYRYHALDNILSGKLKEAISDQLTSYVTDVPVENIDISATKYNGFYFLILKITLIESDKQIIFGIQQQKGELVNFNFKVYDNEKVQIW